MSKAGKRVKSGAGQGGPAKWEAALLAAQFEEVNPKILLFDATSCTWRQHEYCSEYSNKIIYEYCTIPVYQNCQYKIKLYLSIVNYY